jgi:hypothetical protein
MLKSEWNHARREGRGGGGGGGELPHGPGSGGALDIFLWAPLIFSGKVPKFVTEKVGESSTKAI